MSNIYTLMVEIRSLPLAPGISSKLRNAGIDFWPYAFSRGSMQGQVGHMVSGPGLYECSIPISDSEVTTKQQDLLLTSEL